MRTINFIVVHCTDTLPNAKVESIKNYWKDILKWETVGYHYIIKSDGEVVQLLEEEKISNGVRGYNKECVNLCYIGGKTKDGEEADTRTRAQENSMFDLIIELCERYPEAQIKGHGEFSNQRGKTCPNFNVMDWLNNFTPDLEEFDKAA